MKKSLNEVLELIKGTIIVSCQALPGEPLYCEEMSLMPFMAKAAQQAGSKCIRTSSIRDVVGIKEATGLPVIGLIKRKYEGFESYITPTINSFWHNIFRRRKNSDRRIFFRQFCIKFFFRIKN